MSKLAAEWNYLTTRILLAARKDRELVSAASVDFLMYSGYVSMAYFWALQAAVATEKLAKGGAESREFYEAKLLTADFYFDKLLPRTRGHAEAMLNPHAAMMKLSPEQFAFF